MPRDNLLIGRVSLPGYAYLVTTVTQERMPLFVDFPCARLAVREMRRIEQEGLVQSMAWVLMPDHLHWLFTLGTQVPLSAAIKRFKGRSSTAVNSYLGRSGAVWQRGFHDHAVREGEGVLEMARYIVANPLRAGLVNGVGDYPLWDAIWVGDSMDGAGDGRMNSPLQADGHMGD